MALNFECFICHQPNETRMALHDHLQTHLIKGDGRRNQANGVERCLDGAIVTRYWATQTPSQKCKYCDDPFWRQVDVDSHMQYEHKATLRCQVKFCPYASKDTKQFDIHCRAHALTLRCTKPGCDEWFVLKDELEEHAEHLNYVCFKCAQRFHTNSELVEHENQCGN